jgi:hypothetical protein
MTVLDVAVAEPEAEPGQPLGGRESRLARVRKPGQNMRRSPVPLLKRRRG